MGSPGPRGAAGSHSAASAASAPSPHAIDHAWSVRYPTRGWRVRPQLCFRALEHASRPPLPDAPSAVGLEDASDWPSYRFDASMVIVPEVRVDSTLTLLDAPVLYGGGGGTDIFDDLWAYDAERGEFVRLDTTAAQPRPWAREQPAEVGASSSPSVLVAVAASLALVAACAVVGLGVWRLTGRRHRARRALAYVHHREADGAAVAVPRQGRRRRRRERRRPVGHGCTALGRPARAPEHVDGGGDE